MITPHALTGRNHTGSWVRVARSRLLGGALAALVILGLSGVAGPASLHAAAAPRRVASQPRIGAVLPQIVLAFQTMVGNSGPYIGTAGALSMRGIPAGGAPWKIISARGVLTSTGAITVFVHGLTLLNGINPVPKFEAAVSCQSIDGTGAADVANVFTGDFPATTTGNSIIVATVALPSPCFAPLIFITSPGPHQAWFAVTGV